MQKSISQVIRVSSRSITRPSLRQTFPSISSIPVRNQIAYSARVPGRWYSTSPGEAAATEQQKKDNSSTESAKEEVKEDPKQKEIDAKSKEIVELKDKYLRSVADYRNLQDRTRREIQAGKDFAIQKFARDLIESVDNLDLALSNVNEGAEDAQKELKQLHGGLKMVETVLMNTLKKHGMERFDPSANGDKFDPNIHEATFQTPQPDKTDGTCFHTTQKGYSLNGRVLRAAKVGVVKNS